VNFNIEEISKSKLTDQEKKIVEDIGRENLDYCTVAVLKHRNPGLDFTFLEDETAIVVGGEKFYLSLIKPNVLSMFENIDAVSLNVEGIENMIDVLNTD
jgi:hypothetical protein